jgi:hypothetical protein
MNPKSSISTENRISRIVDKSFWVDGNECPKAEDDNPFWKNKKMYAILHDFRLKDEIKVLEEKLKVSKEQARFTKNVYASKAVDDAYFRFNIFGTQYAVKDKEFLVTHEGEVLEVNSAEYDSFLKRALWAGKPFKSMFDNEPQTKIFIVPRNVSRVAMYKALIKKLPEVINFNEPEEIKVPKSICLGYCEK